jgi:hypothetical protein
MPSPSRPGPGRLTVCLRCQCFSAFPAPRWSLLGGPGGRVSILSRATALGRVSVLTTLVLAGAGFGQAPRLVNLAGLFQRISIIAAFTWLSALSFRALRRMSSIAAPMDWGRSRKVAPAGPDSAERTGACVYLAPAALAAISTPD